MTESMPRERLSLRFWALLFALLAIVSYAFAMKAAMFGFVLLGCAFEIGFWISLFRQIR